MTTLVFLPTYNVFSLKCILASSQCLIDLPSLCVSEIGTHRNVSAMLVSMHEQDSAHLRISVSTLFRNDVKHVINPSIFRVASLLRYSSSGTTGMVVKDKL